MVLGVMVSHRLSRKSTLPVRSHVIAGATSGSNKVVDERFDRQSRRLARRLGLLLSDT